MASTGWTAVLGKAAAAGDLASPIGAATRERAGVYWDGLACALALGFAVLWALGMAHIHHAPPLDTAEQFVWSYATQAGYWKHPPLPTWVMHVLGRAFGLTPTLPFAITQAGIAVALLLLYRVGREWMGGPSSLLAMALTGLVGYHGWCADAFNHNAALLPFQAGVTAAFWFAVRRGRWTWWLLAGLCAGLGVLVKYVAVLPLAGLLLYVLLDREVRTCRTYAGMALAAAVALLVVGPHLWWLQQHGWSTIRYAHAVAVPLAGIGAWASSTGAFVGSQLLRLAPMLALLAWMLVSLRRRPAPQPRSPMARSDRLFLWTVGTTPLVLTLASALLAGSEVLPRWGYNAFLLAGWLVVDAVRWPRERLAEAIATCAAGQFLLWVTAVLLVPAAAGAIGWQGRSNFPGEQFAGRLRAAWAAHSDAPLRIVVTDTWLGGTLVAFNGGAPLAVVSDGDFGQTPWITQDDIDACGALVVQDRAPESVQQLPMLDRWLSDADERGAFTLAWAPSRGLAHSRGQTTDIAWGVIQARRPGDCRL